MFLKQIELKNFRLHKNTSIKFSERLNLIIGGNGQGKTSILEAIYYLCTTKNLNLSSESDVPTFGSYGFEVQGLFFDRTENASRFNFDSQKNKKSYFLDDKQIFSSANIIGKFPIVALIQSDHAITLGSPLERRRFVDSVLSQASQTYLQLLIEYNKILKQRGALLSQIKETRDRNLFNQLEVWTEALIKSGSQIIKHRFDFIEEFNPFIEEAYLNIVDKKEVPKIKYNTIEFDSHIDIIKNLEKKIEASSQDEYRRGVNLVGPHRDDYIFTVNDLELKRFGSQGQHKTFQIALRFAQFFYLKDKLAKTPMFLMDDVFGELDKSRAFRISNYISEIGQSFITLTDLTSIENLKINNGTLIIEVNNGNTVVA